MKIFKADDIVKSCTRIESGLRLGPDAIRACCFSAMISPEYWKSDEVPENISKQDLINKRKELFSKLNDDSSDISCKKCLKSETKLFKDVSFDKLGFVDLAHYSYCNLRCDYCGFTQHNNFHKQKYDALKVLKLFNEYEIEFESSVDFNGGEPTLLRDLDEYLLYFTENKVRVRLYSNGVKFSKAIYEAVENGTITWLIISVDAGTPSTFLLTKGKDSYRTVIENIKKYSKAGQTMGSGKVISKYIFTDRNLSTRDINGYVDDMIYACPQQIWLLYDFFPLADTYENQDEIGIYDFSKHVQAYSTMYLKFLEVGIKPFHFYDTFLSPVINESRELMIETKKLIRTGISENNKLLAVEYPNEINHIMNKEEIIIYVNNSINEKIFIAPASIITHEIINRINNENAIVGIGDLAFSKKNQKIKNKNIYNYYELDGIEIDTIIITNTYHLDSILSDIGSYIDIKKIMIIQIEETSHVSY